ncbi:FHA domain-containing protein [Streptomyces sp. t39]|uniref:FHA domain-containing protein n=1 Tax=Streptomyces sp. t39 TaxID=1828156 RepID=UPI0011CE3563|nr:FHA domain-containing protein [Streptomyces sp. t39]TXS55411.1 FHA domain-containing protein [Streptomyces sp. t39]
MQIRLTVLAPRGGQSAPRRACDVLVTAPAGTALAAVASALASAACGPDASGAVVLWAGQERLDLQRRTLGEPPLVDGAVLALQTPADDEPHEADVPAELHVVAGPDAGGVHLLHGGRISVGRSAGADVPLDDPDVSRLHCEVTVADDGRVTVADLGSTNGTTVDGAPVGERPVRLPAGALLRVGESALRLASGPAPTGPATAPDGEGHLRVALPGLPATTASSGGAGTARDAESAPRAGTPAPGGAPAGHGRTVTAQGPHHPGRTDHGDTGAGRAPGGAASRPAGQGRTTTVHGPAGGGAAPWPAPGPRHSGPADRGGTPTGHGPAIDDGLPWPPAPGHPDSLHQAEHGGAPWPSAHGAAGHPGHLPEDGSPAARIPAQYDPAPGATHGRPIDLRPGGPDGSEAVGDAPAGPAMDGAAPRRRGIGAWARRLTGGRDTGAPQAPASAAPGTADPGPGGESWPDPAAVLLTALGPGPRLWERAPGHPESLVIRLGTADRAELPSVPVTVALREAGSLGLAGPRTRLLGLARSAVAQLAALHAPSDLEIVLISTDRAHGLDARKGDWGWLGWLPHLRPAHGQDCRLLLAYDRDQATARTAELTRRLDDGPLGPGWPSADRAAVTDAAARHSGPRTVVVVDGDPGSAALRETTARLAGAGPAVGIHVICLAETPAASPLSPVAATYEAACAASLPFRECGAVALLSGDVATALRVLRVAAGRAAGHGTVGSVDAVSAAWAERFGRALAPLRTEGSLSAPGRTTALPGTARLLDELGLARATPASLMARWASAAEGTVVLGAGPEGPLSVDLTAEGPHLLIEGPAGSGRTELLRALAASLASAGRPDRLGLLLVDGAGGERGEGLASCTELPHVTEHLVASDPVRMRVFAQALGGELKRRAELLDGTDFAAWHARREVSDRMVGQRTAPDAADQRGDIHSPSSGTLRLRPGGRTQRSGPDPLPRLVVLVDDYDALVAPALGSPGRPAAGSVVRALEAVARDGGRLGVHLIATSSRPDRTADTRLAEGARLRVVLQAPPVSPGPDDPAPGRGRLGHPDGRVTAFQTGRVTGRIPRTATLRPTVVPLEWERMGDPPTRRPVRELGNGPTDLALLASALQRAAQSVDAGPLPPLIPAQT